MEHPPSPLRLVRQKVATVVSVVMLLLAILPASATAQRAVFLEGLSELTAAVAGTTETRAHASDRRWTRWPAGSPNGIGRFGRSSPA